MMAMMIPVDMYATINTLLVVVLCIKNTLHTKSGYCSTVRRALFSRSKIEKLDKNDDDVKQEEDDDNIQEDQVMLPKEEEMELDWIRFGRAVDRISRFVLPVAFIAGTFSLYNETSNHCIPGLEICYNDKIKGMK